MRLIDADAFDRMLIDAQAKCKKEGGNFRFGVLGNVRANLALFPTADRPGIVRCKNCKWNAGTEEKPFCMMRSESRSADWFCADGERREDDA